jgi:hypothetical protein
MSKSKELNINLALSVLLYRIDIANKLDVYWFGMSIVRKMAYKGRYTKVRRFTE